MDNPSFAQDEDDMEKGQIQMDATNNNFSPPICFSDRSSMEKKGGKYDKIKLIEDKAKIWPQILAATGANFGAFAFGTVLSWSATAVPSLKEDSDFEAITELHSSWISSIVTLGALTACLPVGYLVDRIGRRRTLLLMSIPLLGGWILLFFAKNVTMILIGRFITGMCTGAYSLASPIFIAETSQPSIRGMLMSGFDTMASLGVLFQLITGTYMSWRWQSLACMCAPLALFGIVFFVPESPRYLLSKGRNSEVEKSLAWLRGVDLGSLLVIREIEELEDNIAKSQHENGGGGVQNGLRELWKPAIRKSMFIGFMLFAFQIFSGMTATTFYRVEIFKSSQAGLDEYTSSIIVAVVDLFASMGAASVVDRVGRKLLMITSEIIMTLSLGGLGAFFHMTEVDPNFARDSLGWLPLTSLVIFVFGYSVGIGAIPFSIVPEILPQRVRGLGSSLLTTSRWTMAFLVTRFFKDLSIALGDDGCYWFFAVCCLLGALFVFLVVPETKGKSLEVIQQDLKT